MAFTRNGQAAPAAAPRTTTRAAQGIPQFETLGTAALQPVEFKTADGEPIRITEDDVRNYICEKASRAEIKLFLETCKAYQLNPFVGDAYLIHYDNKNDETRPTIVLGKYCYLKMAERHPAYDGFEAGVIVVTPNGEMENREGSIVYDDETILGGWARVYRKDRSRPCYNEVKFSEYNTGKALWAKMPATMIRKVALVQTLRETFPGTFGNLYDESEVRVDAESTARELDDYELPRSLPRGRKAPAHPAVEIVTSDSPADAPQDSADDPFGGEDA